MNETKAKELWAKADAISPWSGTFRIAYSADGTDKEWVEAAANSIRNALGIDAESYPFATSKELRSAIQERTIDAAFKSGHAIRLSASGRLSGAGIRLIGSGRQGFEQR